MAMLNKACITLLTGALFFQTGFANEFQLTSSSIRDGVIDRAHACARRHNGQDLPLSLSIRGIPPGTQYIAIVGDDPDAVRPAGRVWVHWNVFNIPIQGETYELAAGEAPRGDLGRTSGNARGYEGMCPPDGEHRYRFAVFALKERIDLGGFFGPSAMTIEQFENKYKSTIIDKAMIIGSFGR